MKEPLLVALSLAVSALGLGTMLHGRRTEQPPLWVGGLILTIAPWFFSQTDRMVGFAFGIALPMLLFARKK